MKSFKKRQHPFNKKNISNKKHPKIWNADEGMIIEIDKSVRERFTCCDVSWISKFPDECNNFVVSILSEENGIQIVSLKKSETL